MTIEEIHSKYSDLQKEWNKNLKNKAVIYAEGTKPNWELPEDIRHITKKHTKPAVPRVIANVIAKTITIEIVDEFKHEIRDISERINHDLCFSPSIDTKKEFILQRIKVIQDELAHNELCLDGVIQNYPKSIFSENIVQDLYRHFSIKSENDILEIISGRPDLKEGFYHREFEDLYPIYNLNQLIIEVELLSLRYSELSSQSTPEKKTGKKPNPYPLVFSSPLSFEFFMYCISEYSDDRIKPALFAKYYLLFKDERYIIGHKFQPYTDFIIKEFNVKPHQPRRDKSLHPEDNEFINNKSNFEAAKDINNIA